MNEVVTRHIHPGLTRDPDSRSTTFLLKTYVERLEKVSSRDPDFIYDTDEQSDTDKSDGSGHPSDVESDRDS